MSILEKYEIDPNLETGILMTTIRGVIEDLDFDLDSEYQNLQLANQLAATNNIEPDTADIIERITEYEKDHRDLVSEYNRLRRILLNRYEAEDRTEAERIRDENLQRNEEIANRLTRGEGRPPGSEPPPDIPQIPESKFDELADALNPPNPLILQNLLNYFENHLQRLDTLQQEHGNEYPIIDGVNQIELDIDDTIGNINLIRGVLGIQPIQEGEGAILRDPAINPPQVRNLLNKIGQEKVSSITLIRTPLSKATQILLNIASFGQLQQKMKDIGIDKLFHLSMLINGQYELEKNEVIKMRVNPNAIKSNSETVSVPVNGDITIQQLLDNTQKQMGQNYGSYDAKTNNCSIFLSNVLSSNGLSNANTDVFINQKTEELFNAFPSLSKKIVDLGTTTGAVVERQISGEGGDSYIYNFGLPRCKLLF